MEYIVTTHDSNLNVRSGPGPQHPIVGTLARGARVNVVGSQGAWKRLADGRWVHADYLRPAAGAGTKDTATAESEDQGLLLDHYNWPNDPNKKMLGGFGTGSAELRPRHTQWLLRYVAPRAKMPNWWVFLRGHASHLGRDPAKNLELSRQRATAVKTFLIRQGRVSPDRITGDDGVGESWATGPETDDSPRWRAVEVVVGWGALPLQLLPPRWESVVLKAVWLKFIYSSRDSAGWASRPHRVDASNVWKRVVTEYGRARIGSVRSARFRWHMNVQRLSALGALDQTGMKVFVDYAVCDYDFNPNEQPHGEYEFTLPETAEEVIDLYSHGVLDDPDSSSIASRRNHGPR